MRKTVSFIISVVTIVASMVAVVSAQAPDPGTATSFGAVQNVAGEGEVATFTQQFYDLDGNSDASRTLENVAFGDTMGLTPNDTVTGAPIVGTLPSGWQGSSMVSSDQEAAAVVLVQYLNGGIGADGITTADYLGVGSPGSDNFCASVGKRDNEDSRIVVMNTSDDPVSDVSISFKDRSGADVGTPMENITIAGMAQKTFELFDSAFNLPTDFLGSARVQSAGGTPLAVAAVTHWGGAGGAYGTFAYNCQSTEAAATTLYAPKVQRRIFGGNWFDSTGVIVVNTEATNASVEVEFYERDGTPGGSFTDTIPGFSARGYNTRYVGNADPTTINGLIGEGTADEPNWQGSVVVTSDSGQELVGVVKQGYDANKWAGGYNMLSDGDAGTDWFFPLTYRRGFNQNWTDYVGIICQNVSTSNVAPEVTFKNRLTSVESSFTDANPFGQYVSHGYNTRYGGQQAASWFGDTTCGGSGCGNNLADNFIGGAFVSASSDIVCIQETWFEEVYDGSTWHAGGDANLNNVYGKDLP